MLNSNNCSYLMCQAKAERALCGVNFDVSYTLHINTIDQFNKLGCFYSACGTFKQYTSPESNHYVADFFPGRLDLKENLDIIDLLEDFNEYSL